MRDGYPDLVSVTWFAKKISWFKNPGKAGGAWTEAPIDTGFPVEFALLVDLDNDGKAQELLPQPGATTAPLAWYEAKAGAWVKHVVSPQSYGHGIGAGDVNKDGRDRHPHAARLGRSARRSAQRRLDVPS